MKMCHKKDNVFKLDDNARRKITVNESWYIALFVVSRSIKKFFSTDYVNIHLLSIFLSIDFSR